MLARRALLVLAILAVSVHSAQAIEARLVEVRSIGPTVRVSLDLTDAFSDKFLALLDSGQSLFLRVQAELWEDRTMWDKLVRPAAVSVFRVIRDPARQITVSDDVGEVTTLTSPASPLQVRVEAAPMDAVTESTKYYLRVIATLGTVELREAQQAGDVVFGRDDSSISMARIGKLIFRTVVHMTDYLQSVSAEARSRVFAGRELKAGVR